MHFDVPKFVRSPGCDHGHDKESRNGQDIKIDILEAYIWISEVFRVKSGFYRSTEGLPEPPGGLMGIVGLCGEEERRPGLGRTPLPLVRIGQGEGAAPPLPSLSPLSPFPNPIPTRKGGILLPVGVGLLLACPPPGRPHPPLFLYIRRQGHP